MVRPGVYVSEAPLPRVAPISSSSGTYGAFIGTAMRGPTAPALISSWTDFNSLFGGFDSSKSLPVAIYQYFANGGGPAWVCRVISSDSIKAEVDVSIGTPAVTRFTATATTPGVWGNSIAVDIGAVDDTKKTFTLTIYESIRGTPVAVERFRDLTMDPNSTRYVESVVNSTTIGSKFIDIEDTVGDGDPLEDGTSAVVPLAGGLDGVVAVTASEYSAAFDQFDEIEAMLVVNVPGETDTIAGVESSVKARGDSIIVLDTKENLPPTSVSSTFNSSYSAIYYPWLHIADPDPHSARGSVIKVPPGASVAGMILRTDKNRGVFKAPAGVTAYLVGVVANELRLPNAALDELAAKHINVIRPVAGVGISAMGARTQSTDTAQYISVRRTLNYVKSRAAKASRFALFEPNTPALWEQLRVVNGAFLSELFSMGGLAGRSPSEAYYVKCDEDINTPQTIQAGELHIEIGVSPAFPAEFVMIRIGQFEADASMVISEEG